MRQLMLTIGLVAAGLPALAETPPPGLYRVAGVETKLNVRAEPSREAALVGALAPGDADIEVVGVDPSGGWGRINIGEGTGWVSLDFLESQGDLWAADALPRSLRCFGTEPFWGVARDGDTLVRSGVDATDRALTIDTVTGAAGSGSRVVVARDKDGAITLGIAPEQCSDGMSDRAFGLGARLSEGDAPALVGCCSVAP